jgi:hypothetical protein
MELVKSAKYRALGLARAARQELRLTKPGRRFKMS